MHSSLLFFILFIYLFLRSLLDWSVVYVPNFSLLDLVGLFSFFRL
jgi:hypothetical protein